MALMVITSRGGAPEKSDNKREMSDREQRENERRDGRLEQVRSSVKRVALWRESSERSKRRKLQGPMP
eukprot:6179559-Pleurochrysis_carterae.AAC.2